MKMVINLLGICLIVFGISSLAYNGYTYTTREKILQIGELEVTADKENRVYVSPWIGGIALVSGLILVIAGQSTRFK